MSNPPGTPKATKSPTVRTTYVGAAWGVAHYEALVSLTAEATLPEIAAAATQATWAARAADGQHLEAARVRGDGGRLIVVVRFSRRDET